MKNTILVGRAYSGAPSPRKGVNKNGESCPPSTCTTLGLACAAANGYQCEAAGTRNDVVDACTMLAHLSPSNARSGKSSVE